MAGGFGGGEHGVGSDDWRVERDGDLVPGDSAERAGDGAVVVCHSLGCSTRGTEYSLGNHDKHAYRNGHLVPGDDPCCVRLNPGWRRNGVDGGIGWAHSSLGRNSARIGPDSDGMERDCSLVRTIDCAPAGIIWQYGYWAGHTGADLYGVAGSGHGSGQCAAPGCPSAGLCDCGQLRASFRGGDQHVVGGLRSVARCHPGGGDAGDGYDQPDCNHGKWRGCNRIEPFKRRLRGCLGRRQDNHWRGRRIYADDLGQHGGRGAAGLRPDSKCPRQYVR